MKCRKKAYKDKDAAVDAMHLIQNKDDGKKKPVRAYPCENCAQWHLTSAEIDKEQNTRYKPRLDWSKILNK
jgi:hypothetical protein